MFPLRSVPVLNEYGSCIPPTVIKLTVSEAKDGLFDILMTFVGDIIIAFPLVYVVPVAVTVFPLTTVPVLKV